MALPLQVVVDPRLQVASQLGLREPCRAKVTERVRKAAALRAVATILLGKLGRKEENFARAWEGFRIEDDLQDWQRGCEEDGKIK